MLDQYDALIRTIPLSDFAADEDGKPRAVLFVPAGRAFEVEAAHLSSEAAVTKADTNYNTIYLQNNNATANNAVICSLATGPAATGTTIGTAPTAMSTPAAAQKIVNGGTSGATIYLVQAKTGSGLAANSLTLHLRGKWVA